MHSLLLWMLAASQMLQILMAGPRIHSWYSRVLQHRSISQQSTACGHWQVFLECSDVSLWRLRWYSRDLQLASCCAWSGDSGCVVCWLIILFELLIWCFILSLDDDICVDHWLEANAMFSFTAQFCIIWLGTYITLSVEICGILW